MFLFLRRLAAGIMALILTACAYEAETVVFPYTAPTLAERTDPGTYPFEVVATDLRGRRDRFSSKTDAYGKEEAPISSTEPVTEIVRGALVAELRARGYSPGPAGVRIDVAIRTFYTRFTDHHDQIFKQDTADARVVLEIAVLDGNKERYSRVVSATGSIRAPTQRYWGGTAAAVLSDALKQALTQLVDDPAFLKVLQRPAV